MRKYIIALYLRLSIDDKRVVSMSIDSQRKLLAEYVENLGIDDFEIVEFVDNGYSGTNFERPSIQELLEQVKAFKIDCIIVKDFSRFGRNSIEVGYFTEQVFPLFNVRFISVSDNYDSNNHKGDTGGLDVTFKYPVNECYSRDLSKKTKASKYTKMKRGDYDAGIYPYGYKKGEDGKKAIDETVADNVRLIFKLSSEGKTNSEISKVLFENHVLTPAQYKAQNGKKSHDISRCKYWTSSSVSRLLENEQYMGMFVMCKKAVVDVGSTRMRMRDESEWIKISDHHPAIVSKELFEKAQEVRRTFKQPNKKSRNYILKAKVFCGCCKHAMDYLTKKKPEFICYYTRNDDTEPCYRMNILEEELHEALFTIIQKQAQIIANIDSVTDLSKLQLQTEQTIELEKQLDGYKRKKQKLYEQLLMREITLEDYNQQKNSWNEKLQAVENLYKVSVDTTTQMKMDTKTKSQIIQVAKAVKKENTLTQALADTLIEKVFIYPDKRIEIVWKIKDFVLENIGQK